jgi:hypothetical protein
VDIKIEVPGTGLLLPPQEVVSSGSIVVLSSDVITFKINYSNQPYDLEVVLFDEREGGPASVNLVSLTPPPSGLTAASLGLTTSTTLAEMLSARNGHRLTLKNVGSQPAMSVTQKLMLTYIDAKPLYLIFAVQSIGTARIFHYTLSLQQ